MKVVNERGPSARNEEVKFGVFDELVDPECVRQDHNLEKNKSLCLHEIACRIQMDATYGAVNLRWALYFHF